MISLGINSWFKRIQIKVCLASMKFYSLGKLGNRLLYSLIISALVIIAFTIIGIVGIRVSLNENIKGQRTLDRIDNSANSFYKAIIDQETGQRGYGLTEDIKFLEPYQQGKEVFITTLTDLKNHMSDYPDLTDEIDELIVKGEYWHEQFGVLLVEMLMRGEEPSIALLNEEKNALDDIRSTFTTFTEEIEKERTIVRNTMNKRINMTLASLVFIIIGTMLVNLLINLKVLKSIIKPIIDLSGSVNAYAKHDFTHEIPDYQQKDELADLINKVDVMKSELSNSIRTLELKANIDGLTGLYNRRYFNDFLQKHWKLAKEHGENISLILFDIDYFKKYNDTYGHLAGDDCLKMISNQVQRYNENKNHLVARYGGEEFCIVLLGQPKCEVLAIAEDVRVSILNLKIPHETSKVHNYVTVSVGVSTMIPTEEMEYEQLILLTDKALYHSKENGRNRVTQLLNAHHFV